jgi:hypothetical protein
MNNQMKKQTTAWLATLHPKKKNPRKFQMMFINGQMVFLQIFTKNGKVTKNK